VTFLQAGVLLAIGLVLWGVNRLVTGAPPKDVRVEELSG
jgi:hypothetical protein